jgi:hypothetical protein
MRTPREVLLNRHRNAEPKLNEIWQRIAARPAVAPYQLLWRELILPCRRIWAGLACAWVAIAVLNMISAEPAPKVASTSQRPSREDFQALAEQRRMLAQLIGPLPEPERRRAPVLPGPRSECSMESAAA